MIRRKQFAASTAWIALVAIYSALSIRRHQSFLSGGYDLGIFEQIAHGWSQFEVPVIPIVDNARMAADHFSPVLALLGPPYALLPSPITLLVIQALLLAAGVIPLMGWARDVLGSGCAWVIAIAYGLSAGAIGTAWSDFHEVAFAVPLMAFSVVALGRKRHLAAALWAAPLVLVKEDLGVTVALIGVLIFAQGARRIGAWLFVYGLLAALVTVKLLLPAISNDRESYYMQHLLGGGLGGLIDTLAEAPGNKIAVMFGLLVPTAFLALRSPLILLLIPTLAWRFSLDVSYFWAPSSQYDAVLVPIVTAAFIDALSRVPGLDRRRMVLGAAAVLTLAVASLTNLSYLWKPSFWETSPRESAASRLLNEVPNGAKVAATNNLIPHLTGRTTTYLFGSYPGAAATIQPSDWRSANWVVFDRGDERPTPRELTNQFDRLLMQGFALVDQAHGIQVAHRIGSG